jgi:hypothetical protein
VSGYRILNDSDVPSSASASTSANSTQTPLTASAYSTDSKHSSGASQALAVAQELNQKMLSLLGFITEDGLVAYDKLKASAAFAEYCQSTTKLKLVTTFVLPFEFPTLFVPASLL